MNIKNIGCDIVSIKRMEKIYANESLLKKIYSPKEIEKIQSLKHPYEYMAGRFAVKESIIKVLKVANVGIMDSIEVLNDDNGAPYINMLPKLKEISKRENIDEYLVTISHEDDKAIAFVMGGSIE